MQEPGEVSVPSDRPDRYLGYTIARLAARLEERMEAALRQEAQLTVRQFGIMAQLQAQPGMGSGELARRVMITPQSVGGILDTMERAGLVVRHRPGQRGVRLGIELTPLGHERLTQGYRVADRLRDEEMRHLSRTEAEGANAALLKLLDVLERDECDRAALGAPRSSAM